MHPRGNDIPLLPCTAVACCCSPGDQIFAEVARQGIDSKALAGSVLTCMRDELSGSGEGRGEPYGDSSVGECACRCIVADLGLRNVCRNDSHITRAVEQGCSRGQRCAKQESGQQG